MTSPIEMKVKFDDKSVLNRQRKTSTDSSKDNRKKLYRFKDELKVNSDATNINLLLRKESREILTKKKQ